MRGGLDDDDEPMPGLIDVSDSEDSDHPNGESRESQEAAGFDLPAVPMTLSVEGIPHLFFRLLILWLPTIEQKNKITTMRWAK